MVGVQGSGKSFFAEKYLQTSGYAVISNDKIGSRDKSLNVLKKVLSTGKSVFNDKILTFVLLQIIAMELESN